MPPVLSVIVPCYNEEATLDPCIARVLAIGDSGLSLEIIIVDDHSRDGSPAVMEALATRHREIAIVRHQENQGKGAALKSGVAHASGDFVVFQDADMEYDPEDLKRLLVPLREGKADVVFGTRFSKESQNTNPYFWHVAANSVLTLFSNLCSGLRLTDMETCYKMFRREIIAQISIEEKRFGVEPELVAKIARLRPGGKKLRITEVGIRYHGRTYGQGKKIGFKDALRALYCSVKYSFLA